MQQAKVLVGTLPVGVAVHDAQPAVFRRSIAAATACSLSNLPSFWLWANKWIAFCFSVTQSHMP
jgi:hypothetical protein